MPNDDLTPEQLRLVRQAKERIADRRSMHSAQEAREALAQNAQVAQLASSIGQRLSPALNDILSSLREWWGSLNFDGIRKALEVVSDAFMRNLPPNAQDLDLEDWAKLDRLAADEQLCLSWVPEAPLARALLDAESVSEREELLVASSDEVLSTCRTAVSAVQTSLAQVTDADFEDVLPPQLAEIAMLLDSCVEAASAGHYAAAQALATCVIDTTLEQHLNQPRRGGTHSFVKRNLRDADNQRIAALVMGPTFSAVESSFRQRASWGASGRTQASSVTPYSRHATVHAASGEAFTEVAALKAIILATSLLKLSVNPLFLALTQIAQLRILRQQPRTDHEGT